MTTRKSNKKEKAIKKRSKEFVTKIKQKRIKSITLQGAIQKKQYGHRYIGKNINLIVHKNLFYILGAPKKISYFGLTNNIFVSCICLRSICDKTLKTWAMYDYRIISSKDYSKFP